MGTPPVITVIALKGGVGKTTTAVELAAALVRRGSRVLVVDHDPQASATRRLDARPERTLNDVYTWAVDEAAPWGLADAACETSWPGVDAVAAEPALKMREADGGELADHRLAVAVERSDLSQWDAVIVDTPPAGGPLLRNALMASSHALVVTDPEPDGLAGAHAAMEAIRKTALRPNPNLASLGIVVNRYDGRVGEHRRGVAELVEGYGDQVWRPWIPERAAVATASGACSPVDQIRDSGGREYVMVLDDHAARLVDACGIGGGR